MKDEIEIRKQKTGKVTHSYVCGACKKALELYIEKTGVDPMENYSDFIITTAQKSKIWKNKDKYIENLGRAEWEHLFWKAAQSQAAAYRKQFKIAADACEIKYPVSTHSTRKTFVYWSVKLHPYDVTNVDKLQGIFHIRIGIQYFTILGSREKMKSNYIMIWEIYHGCF